MIMNAWMEYITAQPSWVWYGLLFALTASGVIWLRAMLTKAKEHCLDTPCDRVLASVFEKSQRVLLVVFFVAWMWWLESTFGAGELALLGVYAFLVKLLLKLTLAALILWASYDTLRYVLYSLWHDIKQEGGFSYSLTKPLMQSLVLTCSLVLLAVTVVSLGLVLHVSWVLDSWFQYELLLAALVLFAVLSLQYVWVDDAECLEESASYTLKDALGCHAKIPLIAIAIMAWLHLAFAALPWHLEGYGLTETVSTTAFDSGRTALELLWVFVLSAAGLYVHAKLSRDLDSNMLVYGKETLWAIRTGLMLAKAVLVIVALMSALYICNLDALANSVFATGAVGTVILGLAAREGIANIFGGMQVIFDRPFDVGDYILSPDKDIEGTVEKIGWRMTLVRTPSRRLKYIPNSIFSTISVENVSLMSQRRIRFCFGIRYQDSAKIKPICVALEGYVHAWECVDKRQSNFVTFTKLNDSSMDMMVNVFTKPMSFREYNRTVDVLLHEIVRCVHAHKADFAFPTTTVDAKDAVLKLKRLWDAGSR